jgi:hypothetical protein
MSAVTLSGNASGTGTLTIAAPNTNSNFTLTLPTQTGTVSADGPAFSATLSAAQTVTTATVTKIQLDTETFDTASCYNNTGSTVGGIPAYAFLPNVAGYYQVNVIVGGTAGTLMALGGGFIYKNGSAYSRTLAAAFNSTSVESSTSNIIYLNGTTDYLEFFAQINGTGTVQVASTQLRTSASAALIRGA